jgi:hypothetical protein
VAKARRDEEMTGGHLMIDTTPTEEKSFSDRVKQRLNELAASLDRAGEHIMAANATASMDFRAKQYQAHAALEARAREIDEALADMKVRAEAKKAETDATVAEWKARRELKRLERRADDAEQYANAALVVAVGAIEEAHAAILDAITARQDAEDATQGETTKA